MSFLRTTGETSLRSHRVLISREKSPKQKKSTSNFAVSASFKKTGPPLLHRKVYEFSLYSTIESRIKERTQNLGAISYECVRYVASSPPCGRNSRQGRVVEELFHLYYSIALMYLDVTVTQDFQTPKMWKILEEFL